MCQRIAIKESFSTAVQKSESLPCSLGPDLPREHAPVTVVVLTFGYPRNPITRAKHQINM